MKNSGLPTMVEAKSNIPKHITNTMPKTFKSSQSSSLNLLSPAKTTLSTQAWLMFSVNFWNAVVSSGYP